MADLETHEPLDLPGWLNDTALAKDPVESYQRALARPARRELWKYTPAHKITELRQLPAIQPSLSGHEQAGVTVTANPSNLDLADLISIQRAPEAFAQLCKQPLLHIAVTADLAQPLSLHHQGNSSPVIIDVASGVRMTLTEEYDNDCDQQQTMWLRLGTKSEVTHARNTFSGAALHWQFVSVQVQANGRYRMHNHALASKLRRQDTQIQLIGSGAHADLNSAVMVAERLNLDQQITIEHASAHTHSRQRVHNIVADRGKSTFNGRIHIHEGAIKSDAQLSNKNLGLGANATINTKPELEIYTDDVSCSHGATIGQLDNNQLFYLCSRGVAPGIARRLLCEGFLQQCVDGPLAEIAGPALVAPLHDMGMA